MFVCALGGCSLHFHSLLWRKNKATRREFATSTRRQPSTMGRGKWNHIHNKCKKEKQTNGAFPLLIHPLLPLFQRKRWGTRANRINGRFITLLGISQRGALLSLSPRAPRCRATFEISVQHSRSLGKLHTKSEGRPWRGAFHRRKFISSSNE